MRTSLSERLFSPITKRRILFLLDRYKFETLAFSMFCCYEFTFYLSQTTTMSNTTTNRFTTTMTTAAPTTTTKTITTPTATPKSTSTATTLPTTMSNLTCAVSTRRVTARVCLRAYVCERTVRSARRRSNQDCARDFGLRSTPRWCRCCQLDCLSSLSPCIANGWCTAVRDRSTT